MIKISRKYKAGFSMIELLIVVAIIGIIAAIGYPSYTNYLVRAARAEASALLLNVMEKQEQYYRTELKYADDLTELGYATDPLTASGKHQIVIGADTAACSGRRCVVLQAQPQASHPASEILNLDSKGTKDF